MGYCPNHDNRYIEYTIGANGKRSLLKDALNNIN